jgi:heterotetrameric sarcosine oxidase gamma subunit
VSHDFLSPDAATHGGGFTPVARSSMVRLARAAGARFEHRDGWEVAVGYSTLEQESAACSMSAGWADVSHLGKLEIQATGDDMTSIVARCADGAQLELGTATRAMDAWWCPMTPERTLVLCEPGVLPGLRERLEEALAGASPSAGVIEITTNYGAMTVAGPLAREVFARFCALDLRPSATPVHGLRPGSIARGPGVVIREGEDRFLMLFGWALSQYMWTVVSDAAQHLGGSPVGVEALEAVGIASQEASNA